MLSDQEFVRYSRQIMLPQCGEPGQLLLRQSRVLLVGIGGLGCASAAALAAAGVGYLRLCDADRIALSNLQRQLLFRAEHLGQLKVQVAQRALLQLNPHIQVSAQAEAFSATTATALLHGIDWVLDGSDNFATRLLLSRYCQQLGVNLLSAAVTGQLSQLMLWPYASSAQPAYHELFSELQDSAGNCQSQGVLAPLPALTGHWQASLLLQQLLQPSATACLWQLDGNSWQLRHWQPKA